MNDHPSGFHMPGAALTARGQRTHRSAPAHLLLAGCSPCARMRPIPHVSRYITHTHKRPPSATNSPRTSRMPLRLVPSPRAPQLPPSTRSPQPPAGEIGQGNTRAMGLGADADVEFPRLLPSSPVPSLNPLAGWPAAGPTRRHARARTHARTHAGAHTPCAQAGVHTHIPAHAQGGWWGSGMGGGCA
jgi:hypothetical protein